MRKPLLKTLALFVLLCAPCAAARVGSMSGVSKLVGREIFGTLGRDFLRGRAVRLDFSKRVMRFLDRGAAEALRLKAAGGARAA